MQRSEPKKLGDVLRQYIKKMQMEARLKEAGLVNDWEDIVGKAIAHTTQQVYIRDGKLYIKLNSSVARNQLMMMREEIRAKVNQYLEKEIVQEVILR